MKVQDRRLRLNRPLEEISRTLSGLIDSLDNRQNGIKTAKSRHKKFNSCSPSSTYSNPPVARRFTARDARGF